MRNRHLNDCPYCTEEPPSEPETMPDLVLNEPGDMPDLLPNDIQVQEVAEAFVQVPAHNDDGDEAILNGDEANHEDQHEEEFYDAQSPDPHIGPDPLTTPETTPPTFDSGGVYHDANYTLRDSETDQSFLDPEDHTFVTLTMDFDYLSQPEETVSIGNYEFDRDTARFLCHLDLDVLLGRDRSFDTLEYARFAAKNARSDILYNPPLLTEDSTTHVPDDDSEATFQVDNTSKSKQLGETMPKQGEPEPSTTPQDASKSEIDASIPPKPGEIVTPIIEDDMEDPENLAEPMYYKRVRAKHNTNNPESLRKYLAFFPLRVVKETLK